VPVLMSNIGVAVGLNSCPYQRYQRSAHSTLRRVTLDRFQGHVVSRFSTPKSSGLPTPFLITQWWKPSKIKGSKAHSKFPAGNAWNPIWDTLHRATGWNERERQAQAIEQSEQEADIWRYALVSTMSQEKSCGSA